MMDIWKNKVKKKGLQDAFIFTGQVPYKKVPEYIGVMDICVAPHQKDSNQASPVKIFDYMACGRPIVASDIEAAREIIGESECALLVSSEKVNDLAKGIISLIEDGERRKEMSIRGREYAVYNFDRKRLAEDLISII
jgi:glycosyltransferase involved in cell wall biosynthesis